MATIELHPDELRTVACDLAQLGGRTARRFLGKVSASRKEDDTPVTEADHATQEAILDALARRYPTHAVLVEEHLPRPQRHGAIAASPYCWVVDPIDGTRNFGRGLSVYSISVAALCGGHPVAGAIFDAMSSRTYSVAAGSGAFLDDRPLPPIDRPIDSDSTVAISSFRQRCIPTVVRGWMDQFLFRNLGSLCLHLTWVAAGLVDAAYALECKLWDIAAGSLLVEEAGGIVTDHAGRSVWPVDLSRYRGEDLPILVGTPTMHAVLLRAIRA